jgi:hypothetical protein
MEGNLVRGVLSNETGGSFSLMRHVDRNNSTTMKLWSGKKRTVDQVVCENKG